MKKRLLMLLSVFMAITSVGWLHAQNEGYTQDGNNYKVTTAKGLQAVFAKLNKATTAQTTTITLENDLDISDGAGVTVQGPNLDFQGIFYLTAGTDKIASLTIDGQGYAIAGENTSGQNFDPSKKYVFYLDGSGDSPITFKNLTIENTNILAFNLFNLNNLKFDKVALKNNAEGGLHLNSAQLEATGFTTSGNGKFAVKLSRERDNKPKFTLVSGTIGEKNVPQIAFFDRHAYEVWSGNPQSSIEDISNAVVTPAGESWYRSLQYAKMHTSNNDSLAYVWTKDDASVLVSTAEQLESTFSVGFATATEINLAAGTYDLKKVAEVKGNLAIIGKDSTQCKINGKFRLNGTVQQKVAFADITIISNDTAIALSNPEVDLTLDKAAVYGTHGVRFNDYTATKAPSYTVRNSHIKASSHYPLWTRSNGTYTWTIDNSVLEGWCALYFSLGTPIVTVTDSKLYGTTTSNIKTIDKTFTNNSQGNGFSVIMFESTTNGKVTLSNTEVKSFWNADKNANDLLNSVFFQIMDNERNPKKIGVSGNTLTLKNNSSMWIEKPEYTPVFVYHAAKNANYGDVKDNWVNVDNSVKFTYGADNKSAMVVAVADGKIRTAVAPIQDGIDNMNAWTADKDIVTLPETATIDLTKQWIINNAITVKGNKSVIQATGEAWPTTGGNAKVNLLSIEGANTGTMTIEDLTVQNSKAAGINAQSAKKTVLKNVTLKNNATAGLLVHSPVTAESLTTEGNAWGSVNIDKGATNYNPSFAFDPNSSFKEPVQIWSELTDNETLVSAPEGWRSYISSDTKRYWTNASSDANVATAEELINALVAAQPGATITLTAAKYELASSLEIKEGITLKAADGKGTLAFTNGGLKVSADNVTLDNLTVTETTTDEAAVDVAAGVKGTKIVGGTYSCKNVGAGAIRFNGGNGDIQVSNANLTGGIHVLNYTEGSLAGIKGNTIAITGSSEAVLSAIVVYGTGKPALSALDLYNQQAKVTTPAQGAQYAVLYQASDWATYEGVAVPANASVLGAIAKNTTSINTTVLLAASKYELGEQLKIQQKGIKLVGTISDKDTTAIMATGTWTSSDALVKITAANVSLENLNVKASKDAGILVENAKGIALNNVKIQGSAKAGLVINGSTVAATNLRTLGNKDHGVELSKASSTVPLFTLGSGCSFAESVAIYTTETGSDVNKYVAGNGWVMLKKDAEAGQGTAYTYWASAASSGINYAITSIPATVVYGQKALPLVTNVEGNELTITVTEGTDFVEIKTKGTGTGEKDSLVFKKPGKALLTMEVKGVTVTQSVEVLKKTLTITGLKATKRAYNEQTSVALTGGKVNGLVGTDKEGDVLDIPTTGDLLSPDAGDGVPVKVTASLKTGKSDYYELAEITGVTDTIMKVKLTYKTKIAYNDSKTSVDYGQIGDATFTAELQSGSSLVSGDDAKDFGTLKFDCPATNTSLADEYTVTPYGYTSKNYEFAYLPETLKVTAVAPRVELTNVKVNGIAENASISVNGRILSNGGTQTDKIKVAITPVVTNASETANFDVDVKSDGTFSKENIKLEGKIYKVEVQAKAGDNLLSSTAASGEINLAAKLQNVNFTSVPSRMTYGSKVVIAAGSTEEDAKLTYAISSTGAIAFNEETMEVTALKAGEATIAVTATKDDYVTVSAKQTIVVEPKLVTVTATAEDKEYDGTTDAKVSFKATGLLGTDGVSLASTGSIKAAFTDKNAGNKKTVALDGECALNGTNASNYTLIQPANPTANITKATIKSIAANADGVTRKYNEKALSYKLVADGLVDGETLTTKDLYSGTISLKEGYDNYGALNGQYTLTVDATFRNYNYTGNKSISGNVEIEKGIPTVITFNTTGNTGADGRIVDKAGWADAKLEIVTVEGYAHATCIYNNGQDSVIGNTVNVAKEAPVLNISLGEVTPPTQPTFARRNALVTRAAGNSMTYGEVKTLTISGQSGYTLTSATPSVLLVDGNNITAIGTGQGAILAKVGDAIAEILLPVNAVKLEVSAANTDKEYDGMTTANLSLAVADNDDNIDNVSLDLKDISFNYASKDAGERVIAPSLELALTGANSNNYELDATSLTTALQGTISPRTLTVTSQVSKFYDGTKTMTLDDYSAEGLLTEEAAPELKAEFSKTGDIEAANVGTEKTMALSLTGSNNYKLNTDKSPKAGNIVKSTLEAIFPEKATSATDLKNKLTYVLHQTGDTIKANAAINAYITVTGAGTDKNPFMVKAAENENCTFIINNKSVDKAEVPPVTPPSDIDVNGIELDETSLTLQLNETATLTAVITPGNATNQEVEWSSSDPTIVSVAATEADGKIAKITALKAGEVTITVTSKDNFNFTATCKVKVEAPTGLEEALANSKVYAKEGYIYIEPLAEMQAVVVSMSGKVIYNSRISSQKQIPATPGVYVVKLISAHKSITTKVGIF